METQAGTIGRLARKARRWLRGGRAGERERAMREQFPLPDAIVASIQRIHAETVPRKGGGCPPRKQRALAHLIVSRDLKQSVEIGVFGGGSLFPQAVGMRRTGGLAIGVDPWSATEAVQKENLERILPQTDDEYVARLDWDGLYREVAERIERYGLANHCRLMRMTSSRAAAEVDGPLDLVHIDGNHDYVRCADDVSRWLPKLRTGGLLVLDDTSWDTIHPQYLELKGRMRLVLEEMAGGSPRPEWAVLEKI
jgi:predicted O-methyltransferase YrrM